MVPVSSGPAQVTTSVTTEVEPSKSVMLTQEFSNTLVYHVELPYTVHVEALSVDTHR